MVKDTKIKSGCTESYAKTCTNTTNDNLNNNSNPQQQQPEQLTRLSHRLREVPESPQASLFHVSNIMLWKFRRRKKKILEYVLKQHNI